VLFLVFNFTGAIKVKKKVTCNFLLALMEHGWGFFFQGQYVHMFCKVQLLVVYWICGIEFLDPFSDSGGGNTLKCFAKFSFFADYIFLFVNISSLPYSWIMVITTGWLCSIFCYHSFCINILWPCLQLR